MEEHHLISGETLLFSHSLIAGPVGDVTSAGTSIGQRQRKGTNSGGLCRPLPMTMGCLLFFCVHLNERDFYQESGELLKVSPPQLLPIHDFNSA